METLIYENKIPTSYRKEFIAKVRSIALQLEIEPDWLMLVMNSESGLNYKAVNGYCKNNGGGVDTCAVGLIQFMPETAKGLGTTNREIYNLSAVKQLDYVLKFYYPYRNKIESFYDLYLATFYPVAMGKDDDFVIGSERGSNGDLTYAKKVAAQNKIIDVNKDGLITIADFKRYTDSKLPVGFKSEVDMSVKLKKFTIRNSWQILAFGVLPIGLGLFIYYKKLK